MAKSSCLTSRCQRWLVTSRNPNPARHLLLLTRTLVSWAANISSRLLAAIHDHACLQIRPAPLAPRAQLLARPRPPAWREARPFVILLLVLSVLVLGTIGFLSRDHPPGEAAYGFFDAVYGEPCCSRCPGTAAPPVPVTLEIGRFLAVIIAGYAVIRGLLALFRDQVQLLWIRLAWRDHVVVCGLGTAGFRMATAFHSDGYRVLAIESESTNPANHGSRERGIPVVIGDATDPSILRKARVDEASKLIAACGADATNIDVAIRGRSCRQGTRAWTPHRARPPRRLRTARHDQGAVPHDSGRAGLRLALFNVFATGAEMLRVGRIPHFSAVPARGDGTQSLSGRTASPRTWCSA